MSDMTIPNVVWPNLSCGLRSTRFSTVLLQNHYIVKNSKLSSSFTSKVIRKVIKNYIKDIVTVTLVFQAVFELFLL